MNRETKYKRILQELSDIADVEGFSSILRGEDPKYRCSANEIFCIFLDELEIDRFVEEDSDLSTPQRYALLKIDALVRAASDDFGVHVPEEELIANENWQAAQAKAREYMEKFARNANLSL